MLINWKALIDAIENANNTSLVIMIEDMKLRVTQVKDEKGFSLLHHAVIKMKPDKLRVLIEYARNNQNEPEDVMKIWIN